MYAISKFCFFITLLTVGGSPISALASDLGEQDLVTPTAREILEQIEGKPSVVKSVQASPHDGSSLVLEFIEDENKLTESHKSQLQEAVHSKHDGQRRIKILSYATARGENDSGAKRTSLERALNVRSFLTQNGISQRLIDMFPMGAQMEPPVLNQVIIQIEE